MNTQVKLVQVADISYESHVNELLAQGWSLHGPPQVVRGDRGLRSVVEVWQVMCKTESAPAPPREFTMRVIMLNDSPEYVVLGSKDTAEHIMIRLRNEYFEKNKHSFDGWESYDRRCRWYVRAVDGAVLP